MPKMDVKPSETKERPTKQKATPTPVVERKVLYPEYESRIAYGDSPLTADLAKKLLGWEETEGEDYLLKDDEGKKVRCTNNVKNRPLDMGVTRKYVQEILNRRWAPHGPNGEPIIVGRTGIVISGQKRLIALPLAVQQWRKQLAHWEDNWKTEPTMETWINYGVDESNETIRTVDNVQTRTLADVLSTMDGFFGTVGPKDRRKLERMADYCIRLLWHRTGADMDAFAPYRTHSEAVEFIQPRHPRILKCLQHILEEDKNGGLSKLSHLSLGSAAGMMYLMGCSATEGDRNGNNQLLSYADAEPYPSEKVLDWANWDRAKEFWTELAIVQSPLREVRYALGWLTSAEDGGGGSLAEKTAVVAKAWLEYADKGKVSRGSLVVYEGKGDSATIKGLTITHVDDEGVRHLDERPSVGGIDLGDPKPQDREEPVTVLTDEELERRKVDERRKREGKITTPELTARLLQDGKKKSATVAAPGTGSKGQPGKPPAPKLKAITRGPTRKEVEAQQTAKARKADEELAAANGKK